MENRRNSESKSGAWHEICDNTFMSLSFVNLAELLLTVHFYTDAVFQNVLDMLFLRHDAAISVLARNDFLEILGVTPCYLNTRTSLRNISEDSVMQSVLIYFSLVDSFVLLFVSQVI